MHLYTYQIGKWRQLQPLGVPLLDTTVKSGVPWLAPTWDMVMGVKKGRLSEQAYTEAYNEILDYTFFHSPHLWDDLFRHSHLAVGCYCQAHTFCHRYLLAEFLQKVGHVTYHGELTPESRRLSV